MAWTFERLAGPVQGGLGGLCWTGDGLLVAAVGEGTIYRWNPQKRTLEPHRRYTNRTNGLGVDAAGNLYGCQDGSRRIVQFCADGSAVTTEVRVDGRIHNHPNSLSIDRAGRIWFSDPHSEIPAIGPPLFPPLDYAAVLRLERDPRREWTLRRMTFDTVAPRAVLVSRDEKHLFVAEGDAGTALRELRAYEIRDDDARLGGYTVLQTFGADSRGPHRGVTGMCLDARGNIVACAGYAKAGPGPVVMVISPSGAVLESTGLPCDLPANCAFGGGAARNVLYVTTEEGYLLACGDCRREGYDRFANETS